MAVRYKFRSEKDEHTYRLSGRSVQVSELREFIFGSRKGLEGMDLDIINLTSRQPYYDDDSLPRGARVEVRVRPLAEGSFRALKPKPADPHASATAAPSSSSFTGAAAVSTSAAASVAGGGGFASAIANMASAAQQKRLHQNSTSVPTRAPPRRHHQRPRH